jgi:hypothetical protein
MRCRFALLALILWPLSGIAQTPSRALNDPKIVRMSTGEWRPDSGLGLNVEAAYLPILYPSSHASNLYQLRNGDILCAWFSGSWEGSSGVGIVMSRLRPGNQRWDRTVLIDRHLLLLPEPGAL